MMTELPSGVYQAKKKDGTVYYRASVTYRTRHVSLGSFPTPALAHIAYEEARQLLLDTSYGVLQYASGYALSFEKWISLVNFRDNRLYFKTPIYLMKKYFIYYLSPSVDLKFDLDDLFYYSDKTIMQRGGHLFVSDYGMQVTLTSRYGIKSHAVEGRDYRFINGDPLDFRYENIEIINPYYGVEKKLSKQGTVTYKVRLHINGSVLVGSYEDEATAAVAYNKAVDMVHAAGLKKDYKLNYVEGLTSEDYKALYETIKLSPRFLKHCAALNR